MNVTKEVEKVNYKLHVSCHPHPLPKREDTMMKKTKKETKKQRHTRLKWLQTVRKPSTLKKELQGISDLCAFMYL